MGILSKCQKNFIKATRLIRHFNHWVLVESPSTLRLGQVIQWDSTPELDFNFIRSQHGDHVIKDVLISNLWIKAFLLRSNIFFSFLTQTKFYLIFFLQKQTKKFRHEIVITASHFRRLNFFYHSFFFSKHLKKKVFFFWHLDFFSHTRHLANP